jgi:hypothetical protein
LKQLFKNDTAAVLGAVVYTYTPYHLYNLYTRGSIGELVAMAILPFILWQIERKSVFFTALSLGALMISHNILAFLYLPLVFVYSLLSLDTFSQKLTGFVRLLMTYVLGIGLSSFFIIPAVYDLQYIIFEKAKLAAVNTNFVTLQLFGVVSAALIVFVIYRIVQLFIKDGKKIMLKKEIRVLAFFTLIGIVVWFLTNPLSSGVWNFLPTTILQYPFRLLCLLPIVCAFLAAYSTNFFPKYRLPFALLVGIAVFITAVPYITPKEFFDRGDMYYANNFATTTVSNEYTPRWVEKQIFSIPNQKVTTSNGTISDLISSSSHTSFTLSATDVTRVTINTTYFPGWEIFEGNMPISFTYHNMYGVMQFSRGKGVHHITAKFRETPVRLFSDILSIFSFLFLVGFVVYTKRVPFDKRRST